MDVHPYWKRGTETIERCMKTAAEGDLSNAPFPLVGDEAKIYMNAQAEAYRHALEMMGVPEELPPVEKPYIAAPVSLDDVSKHINAICEGHLKRCVDAQAIYSDELDALADAVDASPDLDKNAVGSIVLGRVKTLFAEVQKAMAE